MSSHRHPLVVRFGDCDPAGIVYFPRFFDWFHQAMESWFSDALGIPYVDVIVPRKLGFPAIKTEAEFLAPCPLGAALEVVLTVGAVGKKSVTLHYDVVGDGVVRARGKTVVVVCDLSRPGTLTAVEVPPDLRAAIDRFVEAPDPVSR